MSKRRKPSRALLSPAIIDELLAVLEPQPSEPQPALQPEPDDRPTKPPRPAQTAPDQDGEGKMSFGEAPPWKPDQKAGGEQ